MTIEEARQKLEDVAGSFYLARTSIMEAADAYALAAAAVWRRLVLREGQAHRGARG